MTTMGERIVQALAAKGARQADLARACGVTSGAVAQWISGKTKMSAATALRAADFLGVTPLWLTEGAGPMRPTDPRPPELPASVSDLLAELEARLGPQPEAVRRAIAGLVAEYLVKPEGEREALAEAIERMIGGRR